MVTLVFLVFPFLFFFFFCSYCHTYTWPAVVDAGSFTMPVLLGYKAGINGRGKDWTTCHTLHIREEKKPSRQHNPVFKSSTTKDRASVNIQHKPNEQKVSGWGHIIFLKARRNAQVQFSQPVSQWWQLPLARDCRAFLLLRSAKFLSLRDIKSVLPQDLVCSVRNAEDSVSLPNIRRLREPSNI